MTWWNIGKIDVPHAAAGMNVASVSQRVGGGLRANCVGGRGG